MSVKSALLKTVAMPIANKLTSRQFWKLYRQMLKFDQATPDEQHALHSESLLAILQHAAAEVPFWQDQFKDMGINPLTLTSEQSHEALARLPITSKNTYKDGYPQRVTSQTDRKGWRFLSSSGTVDRLTIITDLPKRDYLAASLIRVNKAVTNGDAGIKNVEIPPQCCNVLCQLPETREGFADFIQYAGQALKKGTLRSPETKAKLRGYFRQIVLPRKTLMPINPLPKDQLAKELDERIDQIAKAKPLIIRALPVYLLWLADRLQQRDISFPSLQAVLPWGGLTTPAMIKRIERNFHVPFRDVYGATELGEIAISCGQGKGLHINEDLYHVEILNNNGLPVPPGETGIITVTDFTNRAMPMLRYQLGDIGCLIKEPCECGKTTERIIVRGRLHELTHYRNDQPVTAYDLLEMFFKHDSIINFRVDEQEEGKYSAVIVRNTKHGTPTDNHLAAELQALLKTDGMPTIRTAEFIRPAESGKYRFAYPLNVETMKP